MARRKAGQPDGAEERRPAGAPRKGERAARAERGSEGGEAPRQGEGAARAERGSEGGEAEERLQRDLDELIETRRERDEYLELAKRTKADFENYRKRVARQAEEARAHGKASLATELIPVLDNLERALRAAGVDPQADSARARAASGPDAKEETHDAPSEEVSAHEALARGVALVYRELTGTLERAGVEAYDPAGERFDPTWHEALSTRAGDGGEAGIVLETVEKGYRLNGQVLRAARVVVSE
jgi:molecular chaperone GrpE